MKVFKYEVIPSDYFELELPKGARVLEVMQQYNKIQLWALVDEFAEKETRQFRFAGTGHLIEEDMLQLNHISTFKVHDGELIFHVFEILQSVEDYWADKDPRIDGESI